MYSTVRRASVWAAVSSTLGGLGRARRRPAGSRARDLRGRPEEQVLRGAAHGPRGEAAGERPERGRACVLHDNPPFRPLSGRCRGDAIERPDEPANRPRRCADAPGAIEPPRASAYLLHRPAARRKPSSSAPPTNTTLSVPIEPRWSRGAASDRGHPRAPASRPRAACDLSPWACCEGGQPSWRAARRRRRRSPRRRSRARALQAAQSAPNPVAHASHQVAQKLTSAGMPWPAAASSEAAPAVLSKPTSDTCGSARASPGGDDRGRVRRGQASMQRWPQRDLQVLRRRTADGEHQKSCPSPHERTLARRSFDRK